MFFSKIFFNFLNSGLIKNIYIFNTYMMITMISLVNWLGAFICFLSCFSCKHICTKRFVCVLDLPRQYKMDIIIQTNQIQKMQLVGLRQLKKTNIQEKCQLAYINSRLWTPDLWFALWTLSDWCIGGDTRSTHTYWESLTGRLCRERQGRRRPSTQHPRDSPGLPVSVWSPRRCSPMCRPICLRPMSIHLNRR